MKPLVIAELGHNHGGSVETCKRMITVAAQCGCDAVKLQKRDLASLYTRTMLDAPYDSEHAFGRTYGEHRAALEFGADQWTELKRHADSLGILFFATAFDIPSADFLARLGAPAIKTASGDLTNLPLLEHCASLGLPLIVSAGGHDWTDIDRAYEWLRYLGARFALLQCAAIYPTQHGDMHLRVIETLRECYPDIVIGLSDHQDGISMAPVAWMLGARIFEKHFTLSRAAKGSDNAFSLEPEPMRRMVNDLHGVAACLGDGVKRQLPSERAAMVKMGKSICAARDLPAGHVLTADDIAIKSPGGGRPPYYRGEFVGRRLMRPVWADEWLSMEMVAEEALCSSNSRR
jgi:N-acetylneuraminate synthase/sialic acid synthase